MGQFFYRVLLFYPLNIFPRLAAPCFNLIRLPRTVYSIYVKNVLSWTLSVVLALRHNVTVAKVKVIVLLSTWYDSRSIALHTLLSLSVDEGEISASRPGRFSLRKNPYSYWIGGWTSSIAGCFGEEKNVLPLPRFEIRTVHLMVILYLH